MVLVIARYGRFLFDGKLTPAYLVGECKDMEEARILAEHWKEKLGKIRTLKYEVRYLELDDRIERKCPMCRFFEWLQGTPKRALNVCLFVLIGGILASLLVL